MESGHLLARAKPLDDFFFNKTAAIINGITINRGRIVMIGNSGTVGVGEVDGEVLAFAVRVGEGDGEKLAVEVSPAAILTVA